MWKKLTSFLFKEEEIILEEEEHEIEEIKIKPVEPLKAPEIKKPVKVKPEPNEDIKAVSEETKEFHIVSDKKPKRSMMIDLNDKPIETVESNDKNYEYKRKNIISPIFGGDEVEEDQVIKPLVKPAPKAKTQVISPMYGSVTEDEELEEVDLEMDLEDILADEPIAEEVQTSLFDYLEEPESDE